MKVIVTESQLNSEMTTEQKSFAGYTDEILEKIGLTSICLKDCVIGEIESVGNDTYIINPNLANPNKLPRKVAYHNLTTSQVESWVLMVGEENIITE